MHKWLEEWYDTLLYLGVLMGSMIFFLCYWKGEYQARYAEVVLQEFLTDITVAGKITLEEYEKMVRNIAEISPDYEVNIVCREYVLQPVYALIPEEKLVEYYLNRNVKKEAVYPQFEICVKEEAANSLRLQVETNATIMAAGQQEYLPLPEESMVWRAEAVRPYQEVYEGEELITICCIVSQNGNYYAEAEPVTATDSGIIFLQLSAGDERHQIPVEVLCHPRTVICENGHEVVNSSSVLEESKKNGNIACPYCKILPDYITCNAVVIQKETGTELKKEEVWITVTYLDGHTEQVTPESEEWLDSYDKNYCGIQQVTIRYRGKEDSIVVISENNGCQQCNQACNERCYTDYITFPYCTECMSNVLLFTGEVHEEEQLVSVSELVACLDEKRERLLDAGDLVTVYLFDRKKCITVLQKEIKQDGRSW